MLVITVYYYRAVLLFKCNALLLCSNLELKPSPELKTAKKFLSATGILIALLHINLVLVKAHKSIHKFDVICLSEKYRFN